MKKLIIVLIAMVLLLSACTAEDPNMPAYMPSKTDYSAELELLVPEGLAQQASQLYKDMVNGDLGPTSGYEALLELVTPESADAMAEYEKQFTDEISATQEYLESQNDSVTGYEFAETVYTSEDEAYILRIQIHESGQKYYFRQDFKRIDGEWKIAGDNIEDPFRIKHKILFWYN
jgi:hypothetical protein